MTYYCLECNADCGGYKYCCKCDENPAMMYKEHPGFITDADINAEIAAEEFWENYTS